MILRKKLKQDYTLKIKFLWLIKVKTDIYILFFLYFLMNNLSKFSFKKLFQFYLIKIIIINPDFEGIFIFIFNYSNKLSDSIMRLKTYFENPIQNSTKKLWGILTKLSFKHKFNLLFIYYFFYCRYADQSMNFLLLW